MKKIILTEIPDPPTDPVKHWIWAENALITWPFLGLLILLAYKQLTWLSARLGHAGIVDLLADLWALLLAFALVCFLLALSICARAYELTVGSAYRARDAALQNEASRALKSALHEAECELEYRQRDLDSREREYSEKNEQLRREQTDLHLRNLEFINSRRNQAESTKHTQAQCSGKRRRKGTPSHESVFDSLP